MLIDANNILQGTYLEELASYKELISRLDNIVYMYSVYLMRDRLEFDTVMIILDKIKVFIKDEMIFFEKVFHKIYNVDLLDKY